MVVALRLVLNGSGGGNENDDGSSVEVAVVMGVVM